MATLDLQDKKDMNVQETELKEQEQEEKDHDKNLKKELKGFLKFAIKELNLNNPPAGLTLSKDQKQAKTKHTFGYFSPEDKKIWIYVKGRNTADVLRTLAHELIHLKQAEEGRIENNSGDTGSPIENEANAMAGVLLRKYGSKHENIYEIQVNKPVKKLKVKYNSDEGSYEIIHDFGHTYYTPYIIKYDDDVDENGNQLYFIPAGYVEDLPMYFQKVIIKIRDFNYIPEKYIQVINN
jgi:Zn-dependent peptidase ImmA (M78 family)